MNQGGAVLDEVYLITGVTGFLGCTLAKALIARGKKVVGLRLPQDKEHLLSEVEYQIGDITKPYTLSGFFKQAEGKRAVLIHCAGIVTIASGDDKQVRKVNVDGTRHIVDLAMRYQIDRFIYVSSVHAIKEGTDGTVIKETTWFSADSVKGIYGKSKAEATAYVLGAARQGFHAMVVHPSGMIGPGDDSGGYMTETIRAFLKGRFPAAVEGGYDFVDVRDVAEGIIRCAEHGRQGETYILSNRYITVKEMFEILSILRGKPKKYRTVPLKMLTPFALLIEKVERKRGFPLLITPYSLYTLGSNGNFSHEKADRELGYSVRPIERTLADMTAWILDHAL